MRELIFPGDEYLCCALTHKKPPRRRIRCLMGKGPGSVAAEILEGWD